MLVYLRIESDPCPLDFAKLFGFRRAIVHGMWTLAMAIAWAEEQGLHITSCHARFYDPYFFRAKPFWA